MSGREFINSAMGSAIATALIATVLFVSGCQTLHNAGLPGMEPYLKPDTAAVEQERSYRDKFVIDRDHDAFFWLLSHRVANGMTLNKIEEILGEPGEYTADFSRVKSDDAVYHATDSTYKWGPDNKGNSAVIFFRDNHAINFNPKDFQIATPKVKKTSDE